LLAVEAVSCEPVSLLFAQYQGDFPKKQRAGRLKCEKRLRHSGFRDTEQIR
jgi:hypothetical protein